jgi:hypothetical protein
MLYGLTAGLPFTKGVLNSDELKTTQKTTEKSF